MHRREALELAGVAPGEVDLIVDTSCTGLMIPALDVYVANALGLAEGVRRLPLTEVGCAAGATALALAADHLLAYPQHTVLLVSVELPSLTLQLQDPSRANLISAAISGDGPAALVLQRRRPARVHDAAPLRLGVLPAWRQRHVACEPLEKWHPPVIWTRVAGRTRG